MTIGTLYGLGVGPGDPELITVKAFRKLQECPVIAYPKKLKGSKSYAHRIVEMFIAWIVAVSLIYGGKQLLQYYTIDFTLLKYCLIIGSLAIAYIIIYKMTPKKLKDSLKI